MFNGSWSDPLLKSSQTLSMRVRKLPILLLAAAAAMPVPATAEAAPGSALPAAREHPVPHGMRGTGGLISYTMPGATRAVIEASALVFVPSGKAPKGGWPVVAWAHGTTTPGNRDCAPSLSPDFDGGLTASGARSDYAFEIASLVNAGFAVVAPDYEGLGAIAKVPYAGFNSRSTANAVLYGIAAARSARGDLSHRYVVVGHSDGARSMLGFETFAATQPTLEHRATVAFAPFIAVENFVKDLDDPRAPASKQAENVSTRNFVVSLVAEGIRVQHPGFDERRIMGEDLAQMLPQLRSMCALPAGAAVGERIAKIGAARFRGMKPAWAADPIVADFLDANDPARRIVPLRRPTLLVVGTNDAFVPAKSVRTFAERQRRAGARVQLSVVDGGDHFSIIRSRTNEAIAFIRRAFAAGSSAPPRAPDHR